MKKLNTLQEWYDIQYQEYLKYYELLEHRRTIENLEFKLTYFYNNPEYQYFSKQIINRNMINLKKDNPGKSEDAIRGEYEGKNKILIPEHYLNRGNWELLELTIVHELIHFFDYANIVYIHPSNIYTINYKLKDTNGIFRRNNVIISIDVDAFVEMFNEIKNISKNNSIAIRNIDAEYLINIFPDANIKETDSILIALKKSDYTKGTYHPMNEVRAYIGMNLYAKYTMFRR